LLGESFAPLSGDKKTTRTWFLREPPTVCGTEETSGTNHCGKRFSDFFSEARFWERLIRISTPETFAK
jgi:hypothetical protein